MKADPQHSEEMLMRKKDDFDLYRNILDESGYYFSRDLQIANFFQNRRENSETSFLLNPGHFLSFSSKVNTIITIRHISGLRSHKFPMPWASLYSPNNPVGYFHRPLICRMIDARSRTEPHKEVHTCPDSTSQVLTALPPETQRHQIHSLLSIPSSGLQSKPLSPSPGLS